MLAKMKCPVCGGDSAALDVVDFNKSCEEANGKYLPLSGETVYYYLCGECDFCFAPKLYRWKLKEFSKRIYNEEYEKVDPDYKVRRPTQNASNLVSTFKGHEMLIKHMDYGGGNGLLSDLVRKSGWRSSSYDPFVNRDVDVYSLGTFNLITAFEVFEHVPDVNSLMSQLDALLDADGVVLCSTLLSDGNIASNARINWWYASPRNGHISLYSKRSLSLLAEKFGFQVVNINQVFHLLYRKEIPVWASGLVGA